MKQIKPLNKRNLLIVVIATLIFVAVVATASTTIAYYLIKSDEIKSTYTPTIQTKTPSVNPTYEDGKMKNVKIKIEDAGYPVFIRVAVIVTWQKAEGVGAEDDAIIHFSLPVRDVDYKITFNSQYWACPGTDFSDNKTMYGYFYYKTPVRDAETEALVVNCELMDGIKPPEDGYYLNVEFVVQTIQAIGSNDSTTGDGAFAWDDAGWQDAWDFKKN